MVFPEKNMSTSFEKRGRETERETRKRALPRMFLVLVNALLLLETSSKGVCGQFSPRCATYQNTNLYACMCDKNTHCVSICVTKILPFEILQHPCLEQCRRRISVHFAQIIFIYSGGGGGGG
jgi:hypothetical protein